MPNAESLVNWEHARAAMGGDEQLLNFVIEAFLEEGPRLLARIQQGLAERDAATLQRAAHTLRGGLGYFGDLPAAELAMQLEIMGRRNSIEDAVPMLAELEVQLARVLACLTTHLGQQAA